MATQPEGWPCGLRIEDGRRAVVALSVVARVSPLVEIGSNPVPPCDGNPCLSRARDEQKAVNAIRAASAGRLRKRGIRVD